MSYKQYIHNTLYDTSYADNINWIKLQYEKYGDRIVFADISPNEDDFMASVIVKDKTESEPKTQQS